jgi:hypothetical protein
MTGEISLRGAVTAIGGLPEKLMAAVRGGVHTVLIPRENEEDLKDVADEVREKLQILPVDSIYDVLKQAGIGYDVTMVPHEEVWFRGIELLHTAIGESGSGTGDDLFVDTTHHLQLEVADGAKRQHHLLDIRRVMSWIDISTQQTEEVAIHNTLHCCRYLTVIIRTDIVELIIAHLYLLFLRNQ